MSEQVQKDLTVPAPVQPTEQPAPVQQQPDQAPPAEPSPPLAEPLPEELAEVVEPAEPAEELRTEDFIMVTHKVVTFNKMLYPGAYDEIEIKVSLKPGVLQDEEDQSAFLVKVIARCDDDTLNALDEYVYSVRYYTERLQFFEQVRFRIRQKTTDFFRVAVKMPAMKQTFKIKGALLIQLQQAKPLEIPIESHCTIPNIVALKTLYSDELKISLIKLAIKRGVRPALIMFKNNSAAQLTLEVQIIGDNEHVLPYDLSVANPVIAVTPNQQFMVQLISKHIDEVKPPKFMVVNKALLLKIKCSCVYYCFPLEICFMDVAVQNIS